MSASISALNTLTLTGHSLNTEFVTSSGIAVPLDAVMDVFSRIFIIAAAFMVLFCVMELLTIGISYFMAFVRRDIRNLKRRDGNDND